MNTFQVKQSGKETDGSVTFQVLHGSSIPPWNVFRGFPTGSCWKVQEINWNPSEKIQKIPYRNTASMFRRFPVFSSRIQWISRIFPAGSCRIRCPESSTWVLYKDSNIILVCACANIKAFEI